MRDAIARNRFEQARAQGEIGSGQKFTDLGTDPASASIAMRNDSLLRSIDGYRRSASEANNILSQTDTTLQSVNNDLQHIYELAVKGGNDTNNAQDRASIADEVAQTQEQLIATANTKIDGRYVFGGLKNAVLPPFDALGTFTGDTGKLTVAVGQGVTVDATLPGGEPFTDPSGLPGATIFTTVLTDLQAALRSDNGAGVRATLDQLQSALDRVGKSQQEIGHAEARLDGAGAALDRISDATKMVQMTVRDTDYADAVMRLQQAQTGLEAALVMTTQLEGLNLVKMLGG